MTLYLREVSWHYATMLQLYTILYCNIKYVTTSLLAVLTTEQFQLTDCQNPSFLLTHSHKHWHIRNSSSRVQRQSNKRKWQKGQKQFHYKEERTALPKFSRGQRFNFETNPNLYSVKMHLQPHEHVCMKRPIDPATSALLHVSHMRRMTGGRIEGEWGFIAFRLKCQKAHLWYACSSKALYKERRGAISVLRQGPWNTKEAPIRWIFKSPSIHVTTLNEVMAWG